MNVGDKVIISSRTSHFWGYTGVILSIDFSKGPLANFVKFDDPVVLSMIHKEEGTPFMDNELSLRETAVENR